MAELPKIVAQRLRTAPSTAHPDADVITAFAEKSLSERERDQVLGHLAECHDCREVLALSFPSGEVAAVAPVRPIWLTWPVLRWGALAACVVVVGAAVTLHRDFRPGSPDVLQKVETPANISALPSAGIAQPSESKTDLGVVPRTVEPRDQESLGELPAAKKTARASSPITNAPRPSAPAPPQAAEGRIPQLPFSSNALDGAEAEAVPGRAKDALAPTARALATGGPRSAEPSASMAMSGMAMNKSVAAVGLLPRWTLSADGTLQRSFDSGRTWDTITVAGQSRFRALAADGLEIWVGGAQGALYHSSNAGQDWIHVQPSSNGETLTEDIIGVEFVDKEHGTVTTSGQEKWVTSDAGQSWQKQ